MVIWHWNHSRLALKTSNCAALSRKNAHAAQSLGNWETWSTWARVPADDECLSAPWREECREREEWGGGRMVRKRRDGKSREQGVFCIGGGEEELHHKGIWKQSIYKRCQFPFLFTKRKGNWPQAGVTDFIFIGNKLYSSSCSFWIYNSHPGSLFFLTKETNEKWHKWNDGACVSCFAAYFCLECSRALLLSPSVCLRCSCRDDTPYSSFPSDMGSWSLFTDHAGTLSSPLLNPLKICCIYKPFF